MTEKCIVLNCTNHRSEGRFLGELCVPCHAYIKHGEGKFSQAYRNVTALTEPLEQEIAGLEDRHRVALFRLDKADDLALQRLNSMAKLSSRIAELESALAIADRDRKNAELAIDDAEDAELLTVSPEAVAYGNFKADGTCCGLSQHPEDIANWANAIPLGRIVPVKPMTIDQINELRIEALGINVPNIVGFARSIERFHGIGSKP